MTAPRVHQPILLVTGILLIAASLRAPITGVAPVLDTIRHAFGLGNAAAGALTTLPLLVFAIMSPVSVLLARRYGLERSLFIALLAMAVGIILRSSGPLWGLFLGTGIIGMGIAIANVLLPSLVKRDFPGQIATLTSAYAMTAGVVASLASGAAVPIAQIPGSGWNWALGAMIVFPVAALILWLPQLASHKALAADTATPPQARRIWHSALAWQVTFFFGLNSLVYYTVVTWLPAILIEAGYSPATAGSFHGVSQLATAVPGLFIGPLVKRMKNQQGIAVAPVATTLLSLVGLLLLPAWAMLWAALFGFGAGATFILGLALFGLRASTVQQASALSGMAQTVGYTIAAGAPPLMGRLHDAFAGWTMPLVICIVLCCIMAVLGHRAGRPEHV